MDVPLTSLIVMNSTIVHEVRKSQKRFRIFGSDKVLEKQNSAGQGRQRPRKGVENQLTLVLLLVTTLFLVLLIPTYVRFLYFAFVNRDTPERHATAVLFLHLSTRLYFTNCGINFSLYCISGKKFRRDLKNLLSFEMCKPGHNDSFQTTDLQMS